jgi:hypothetical protein
MEHTPSESGAPGTNQEEGRYAPALADKDPSVAKKAGAGSSEEDWLTQATGDPAFWIKELEVG